MKKIIIPVAVLAVILLMAPVFISKMVSTKYSESLDQLSTNPSIKVLESEFSPQWFSAQSITKLRLMGDLGELYPYDIVLQDDIQFGPVIVTDNGLSFNLAYTRSNFVLEEGSIDEEVLALIQDNLSLTSKVTYGLSYVVSWSLAEITPEYSGDDFVLGAMKSEMAVSKDNQVKGYYHWDGLTLTSEGKHIEIKGMDFNFDGEVVAGNLYAGNAISTGHSSITIPQVSAKDLQGNNLFSLNKLIVSAQTQLEGKLLNSEMVYQIDEINMPALTFKAFDFTMLFENLELDTLIDLNDLFMTLSQEGKTQPSVDDFNEISTVVTHLLEHEPEITIKKLSVETPDGLIDSDANLVFKAADFNVFEPMALLGNINADAKGFAPKAFLNRMGVGELMNVYTEHGFLRDEKENIAFTLNLKGGQLKLNELTLPL